MENTQNEPVVETKKNKLSMPKPKVVYIVCGIVVVLALIFFFKSSFVVAMVNGHFISRASLNKEMEAQVGQKTLDSLIVTSLVENKVKDIELSDEEVDAEIKKTSDQLEAQGRTLEEALSTSNITEADFRKRVTIQLKLEKLLADKTTVSDEEVSKFIAANRATLPKVDQTTLKAQVADSLQQDKFNKEVADLIETMKSEAKIRQFIEF